MTMPRLRRPRLAAMLVLLSACSSCTVDQEKAAAPRDTNGGSVLQVVRTEMPLLVRVGPVRVFKTGHGSAIALLPGTGREVFLLTDRGPNIDGPDITIKIFPDPTYAPRIYRAQIDRSKLRIKEEIILKRSDGTPLTGLPIPGGQCGGTTEIAHRLDGTVVPSDAFGIDSEGMVAVADGSFWISDEYGPFLAHFDRSGRELERLSPCNGGLPEVYKLRRLNRGMEGLTITPDGAWLVGIMQSPLQNPSADGVNNISRATRILFRNRATGATREYIYLLDIATLHGVSEIAALSGTRFLVIERDGNFLFGTPPATVKRIYEIDVTGATDVSSLGALGATPIGGTKTIEQATADELRAAGIVPVSKSLRVDLVQLGYPHDKPEGLAVAPEGSLFVSNDDDFAIAQSAGKLIQKTLPPASSPDFVSIWQIRLR
jgi:Esterase-like activity of phytase